MGQPVRHFIIGEVISTKTETKKDVDNKKTKTIKPLGGSTSQTFHFGQVISTKTKTKALKDKDNKKTKTKASKDKDNKKTKTTKTQRQRQ